MNQMDTKNRQHLSAEEICVITPTKGRHKQLRFLLKTLAEQSTPVGKIIIADGGRDAEELVDTYRDRLPVMWLDCPQPGQVIQRNLALGFVENHFKVIIYFDDDIQLEQGAVEAFVAFWNSHEAAPAGVSFNLTNMPSQPDHFLRRLFCMGTEPRGRVLKSGYNTPAVGVEADLRSDWLIGGATGWRKDVLLGKANEEIPSRWAITEDLMFSYPLYKAGQILYVCASARAAHIDDTPTETFDAGIFRGNAAVLWRYFFVVSHPELSRVLFFWMVFGQILGRLAQGMFGNLGALGYAWGYSKGFSKCLISLVLRRDIRNFLG